MSASTIVAAAWQAAFAPGANSIDRVPAPRSTLASSSPASRGEGSWLAALMIALALLALWAWLRLI